ncbi:MULTISPECIES: ClpP-like prohead protease/major capsid protein fusion protein [unclassified Variovorax]|uniref:ClpP-like prohead protease/major capsid protein fusion protein n=1 Tax=unclassified Variovorax TaxID=663243 RepID=UPI002577E529|nr:MULTISPECIES: ClpP-like prohead protease/major capsid protein fusion protein [unclassified Variovorax]MDM0086756.1 Clp protease ClpP [Variovorax sp. J22G40]MDM0144988.1 Clp protease ClpP [Variovorax sp. J2P1-31]
MKQSTWYAIRRKTAMAAAVVGALAAAEIYIYGDIGESWYEETTSAATFVRELQDLDVEAITIRVNSMGGSVPDGFAIYNAIRRHKATVTIEVDGVAFSIASLIAMAGDKVHMASNAMLMVHAPWQYAAGNSVELRDLADQLDTWAAAMSTSYAARTGDQAGMLALLTDGKDHFYTAEEALAMKFIDGITDAMPVSASASAMPLNRYRSLPANVPAAGPSAAAAALSAEEESMKKLRTPLLLSAVGAAAAGAGGGGTAAPAVPAAPVAAAVDQASILAADKVRRDGIRASFAPFASRPGVDTLRIACEDDHGMTVQAAGQKLLAELAKGSTPVAGAHVITMDDEADKQKRGATQALLARAGYEKIEGANPYRGYTLAEMARASLTRAGFRSEGMDKMQFVGAAFTHSTSDFPLLLANVASKALMKGYLEAEETFQLWTRAGSLPDFKPGNRVDLNAFPSLRKVAEGAEYKYATMGERGNTVVLATYGELFSITRQAIINDDLDAFTRVPRLMGRAAIRTVGDLVYAILTANPPMPDGKPLFHADHGNLLAASGINTASVDAMQSAMALQKQGATALNIGTKYLIVPRALKGIANVVRASEFEVGAAAKNNSVPNSVRETFEVVSDARLDAASTTAWYGAADQNSADTVEVNYLDGNDQPYLEQKNGWNVDGTEFKVRIDAGVSPLDWRTLAKNPGQA